MVRTSESTNAKYVTKQRVLWGDTEGFMDLLYGALGVITEETQGAEDDPNTMATGTGTSKPYRSTGGLCGIATHRLGAHRVLHSPTQRDQAEVEWEKLG